MSSRSVQVKINRHGERERFSEFSKLHNRMLLWHGSLTANIASIIQQDLKLSASRSGIFGRGLCFSDSVSKSAEYCKMGCFCNEMLLLCEVALGNMLEQGERLAQNLPLPPESHSVYNEAQVNIQYLVQVNNGSN